MIPHISEYFRNNPYTQIKKALIIGKGPSFEAALSYNLMSEYFTIAINEACKHVKPDINFFIDVECLCDLNGGVIFTPAYMHRKHAPESLRTSIGSSLEHYAFDLARPTGMDIFQPRKESDEYPDQEPLMAISNSFEAAFHMLCIYGFKEIHSIGIDGGTEYHELFRTKEKPNSLNPNLTQFETVAKQSQKYGVKYVRL